MSTNDCGPIEFKTATELWAEPEPEYPKVYRGESGQLWIGVAPGLDYEVPDDPVKVLGLMYHFTGKSWATRDWIGDAIERVAKERGGNIHE